MKVLVLGGTGFIGSAVVERLIEKECDVTVLCRNDASCDKAESLKASVIRGDISHPESWLAAIKDFDAVIHSACGFGRDMGTIDTRLTKALLDHLSACEQEKTFIYTAGTWCYGHAGKQAITEKTDYCPMPEFGWMVDNSKRVQNCKGIRGMTIHPAIVVDDPQGIPAILLDDFESSGVLSIPCAEDLHWPIVDRYDLADAYCLALEKGLKGESYNVAGIESASVASLSVSIAKRHDLLKQSTSKPIFKPIIKPIEYWMEQFGEISKGYEHSQNLVSLKAREMLGWKPTLVSSGPIVNHR